MPLRGGKTRVTGAVKTPIGHVRRAQQITTYGVGSLIAIGDQSFIVSGLDSWKDDVSLEILEPRLQHVLRAPQGLRLPPADQPSSGRGIGVRRFPGYYSCKKCQDLKPYRGFEAGADGRCKACDTILTPSRFIMACSDGHIDDFPYWAWVHKHRERVEGAEHALKMRSTGETASLRSIIVSCSCGEEASMEGSFGAAALSQLGIRCTGARPWLGRDHSVQDCARPPRTLQRGSSAAWFSLVRSALSIPPWSQRLQRVIAAYYETFVHESDETILRMAGNTPKLMNAGYTPAQILEAVRRRERLSRENEHTAPQAPGLFQAADELRVEEYRQLCDVTPEIEENPNFVCVPPSPTGSDRSPDGIGQIMLVKRLREVRALTGFVRVDMPLPNDPKSRKAPLSTDKIGWLPAIEVTGEGVFLRIDAGRLHEWERRSAVVDRVGVIRQRHEQALFRRFEGRPTPSLVTPRLVLVHTLAHCLINEWSLDAGYPAGALSERLYVDDGEMAGLLIYTATSDSAGSLGGVVAQGAPGRLAYTLESAMDRASWCSADPLCMESEATGADSLNLAACHACTLLPETSCEMNNTILDRATVIGTPDDPSIGYFSAG